MTIDINNVMVHDFDGMDGSQKLCNKRRYRYNNFYVTVDTKDATEIMWCLTFAPCDSKRDQAWENRSYVHINRIPLFAST